MADVTGGDAAEREAPPRTLLGRLGVVGPGIVVAVTGVGAGDMVTSLVELAKALDRLRHEPPLLGGGEARPEDGYGRASNQRPYWMAEPHGSSAKE